MLYSPSSTLNVRLKATRDGVAFAQRMSKLATSSEAVTSISPCGGVALGFADVALQSTGPENVCVCPFTVRLAGLPPEGVSEVALVEAEPGLG